MGSPLARDVGAEVFILTRDSQMHWLKNESSTFLWGRLRDAGTRGATVDELATALVGAFEVEAEVASADARAWVEHLARHGVLGRIPQGQGFD